MGLALVEILGFTYTSFSAKIKRVRKLKRLNKCKELEHFLAYHYPFSSFPFYFDSFSEATFAIDLISMPRVSGAA